MKPPEDVVATPPTVTTDIPPVRGEPAPSAPPVPAPAEPKPHPRWTTADIVLNRASGSAGNAETLSEQVAEVFRAAGLEPRIDLCEPADLVARLREAGQRVASSPGSMLVVGGGDGTIKTAAEIAFELAVPLGVLPMGTMNLLPKDLGMPLDVLEAARAIAAGVERRIDVAHVNGRAFLHSSAIGVVPLLGAQREEFRKGRTWRQRGGALWRAVRIAFTVPRVTLRIDRPGARPEHVRTFSIAVSNNLLSDKPGEAFRRLSLDGGRLAVYISRHRGRLGLLALLFTLGTGRWTLDREMESQQLSRLRITSFRRRLAVSNDGEIERLRTPLNYSLTRGGLRVVVAPPAAPADAPTKDQGT